MSLCCVRREVILTCELEPDYNDVFVGIQTIYYRQYLPLVKVTAINFQFAAESSMTL